MISLACMLVAAVGAGGQTADGLLDLAHPPTSFCYGGEAGTRLLERWERGESEPEQVSGGTQYTWTWSAPDGFQAQLRALVFDGMPAMELQWVFTNTGSSPSELLTEAYAIDLSAPSEEGQCVLHTSLGGTTGHLGPKPESTGFELASTPLGEKTMTVAGGRSSNGHLPFYNLERLQGDWGIVAALGWSGQWKATGAYDPDAKEVTFRAGVDPVHFRLPPGESVRMPRALLAAYKGQRRNGANLLRRVLRDHYQGRLNGQPVLPPVSFSSWFVFKNDVNAAMLTELANEAAPLGIEYFCLDAGWFEGAFPKGVGNWTVDAAKFPDGLKAVSDHVHGLGMKFGLWFEPERVTEGTRWFNDHQGLIYEGRTAQERRLLDMGRPEAQRLVVDVISTYVTEVGVDWIRFDLNVAPLGFWEQAEGPEEQGLAQIRYMNGLYDALAELMDRHPNLLIEQCASGGRRIDLEMVRYGHTFWKSDDTRDQALMRFHETGGNEFLLAGHLNTNYCDFASEGEVLALFAGCLGFGADFRTLTPEQKAFLTKAIVAYKQIREYLNGDYYPVFDQTKSQESWNGWLFVKPGAAEGVIVLYRPEGAKQPVADIPFRGVPSDKAYVLENVMTGETRRIGPGRQFAIALEPGNGAVWRFRAD